MCTILLVFSYFSVSLHRRKFDTVLMLPIGFPAEFGIATKIVKKR